MSTTRSCPRARIRLTADPKTSGYDTTFAALVAGLVVSGAMVFVLVLIWLTLFESGSRHRLPIRLLPVSDQDSPAFETAENWWQPASGQFPEAEQPRLQDVLVAVTDSVSRVREQLDKLASDLPRPDVVPEQEPGEPGGVEDPVPEWERWKIEYDVPSYAEYIRQLESLGVSLGAVSQNSNQVVFLDDLTRDPGTVTSGHRDSPEAEQLYFRNSKNRLRRWDEKRLREAGIGSKNRLVVHFCSDELRQTLLGLERARCVRDGREPADVRTTRFQVRPAGDGFEYYVAEIQYRSPQNRKHPGGQRPGKGK